MNPNNPPTIPVVLSMLGPLLQTVLYGLGPVFLVLALVYAGYIRLTAADNSKKVMQANFIIMWAVIGYAVILLSFFIIRFVASILGYDVGSSVDVVL